MNHKLLVEMTRHNIAHVKADTADQSNDILEIPGSFYTDPERWASECRNVFGRLPLVVALSSEIAEPGMYRAAEFMNRPVLVARRKDGTAQAFVNMCTHRGAQIVEDGKGKANRFTCPYHGWTFANTGQLIGVPSAKEFGEIDRDCFGLTHLPTFEHNGFVWAVLDPASQLNIKQFLSGYDDVLGVFGFESWHVFGRKRLESANWKLTYDGYVDFYHLPVLHKKTFGDKFSNRAISFNWGPHQRIVTPDPSLLKLEEKPESEWDTKKMLKGVWPMFPNAALISIDGRGDAMMFSQIFPGDSVENSYSTHVFITERELTRQEERDAAEEQFSFLVRVLAEEDYPVCYDIQKNLNSGVRDKVVFGRNEPGGQIFHGWVDRVVRASSDEELNMLFAEGQAENESRQTENV